MWAWCLCLFAIAVLQLGTTLTNLQGQAAGIAAISE